MSFLNDRITEEALTFDDVLLVPAYSDVLPRNAQVQTDLTNKVKIKIPILSAAMDTVTESNMAIALARLGGIGVIHKNMSIERQVKEIKKVKLAEVGMVTDPITIHDNETISHAKYLMKEYNISGIPVVNSEQKLVGIITHRDIRFIQDDSAPVYKFMTKGSQIISAKHPIDFKKASEIMQKHKIEKLPIVDNSGKLVGLITYYDIHKAEEYPNATRDSKGRLMVAGAVGISRDTLQRVDALIKANTDIIVIDTSHGHSKAAIATVKMIRFNFGEDIQIIAGNIATPEGAIDLVNAGANAVKVGIGPGAVCTTRIIAGVGVPQLSAIYNVYKALEKTGIPVIADGGIRYSGDIVKALAAGASSVMIGSLLAGTEEAPGDTIIHNGRKFKIYRGMSSFEALYDNYKEKFYQDIQIDLNKIIPEGVISRVAYKGHVNEVISQLIGGLKAGMSYLGAATIKDLRKAKFVKITHAGVVESHPHDVNLFKDAPNYSRP